MSKSLSVLVAVGILTITTHAVADSGIVGPQRDPDRAFAMSAGGVAGSLVLVGAGLAIAPQSSDGGNTLIVMGIGSLLFTPVFGHNYGQNRILTTGMKLRLTGMAAMIVSAPAAYVAAVAAGCGTEDQEGCMGRYFAVAGVISGALFASGVIHDLATVREATRRNNAGNLTARFSPAIIPTPSGATAAGLGVAGSF